MLQSRRGRGLAGLDELLRPEKSHKTASNRASSCCAGWLKQSVQCAVADPPTRCPPDRHRLPRCYGMLAFLDAFHSTDLLFQNRAKVVRGWRTRAEVPPAARWVCRSYEDEIWYKCHAGHVDQVTPQGISHLSSSCRCSRTPRGRSHASPPDAPKGLSRPKDMVLPDRPGVPPALDQTVAARHSRRSQSPRARPTWSSAAGWRGQLWRECKISRTSNMVTTS